MPISLSKNWKTEICYEDHSIEFVFSKETEMVDEIERINICIQTSCNSIRGRLACHFEVFTNNMKVLLKSKQEKVDAVKCLSAYAFSFQDPVTSEECSERGIKSKWKFSHIHQAKTSEEILICIKKSFKFLQRVDSSIDNIIMIFIKELKSEKNAKLKILDEASVKIINNLVDEVNKKNSDRIIYYARMLSQGKRDEGCPLSVLPDEILVKIALFTNSQNCFLTQEQSEKIACRFFDRPVSI